MKKITLSLTALLMLLFTVNAQTTEKEKAENYLSSKGELTFTFQVANDSDVEFLTGEMSLIHYDPTTKIVKAWANTAQFRVFEALEIAYSVPVVENEVEESIIYDVRPLESRSQSLIIGNTSAFTADASNLTFPLSSYPTYAEYAQQMQDFQNDYPALVETFSIGTTGEGDKELLFVKISDNVATDEHEPKLLMTSSIHGDEVVGYPMMLTLIDYILTVYSNTGHADHTRVKNLVENTEIWINPSANPDGTYHNSADNTSVINARRGNANNIDLNRNYPDNVAGPHYDGEVYQVETLAFMAMADANDFVVAANFHSGTELINYPFDNAYVNEHEHSDGDWYEYVSVEYAGHCQADAVAGNSSSPTYDNKSSYMTDDEDSHIFPSDGVTHGAEWYKVFGGRQDYMNFYQHCREVTIELSDTKILPESSLDDYWYYNRDALLDYLTQGTYGFRGLILDASNSKPIEDAKISIVGHDTYGSEVYADNHGAYYRPIKAGTYDILIEASCYQSVTLSSQLISDNQTIVLADVLLTPIATVPLGLAASNVVSDSAILSWEEVSGADYSLQYREVGSSTWTIIDLSETSLQLTSLNALTEYEAQIRSNCNGKNSAFSSSVLFTTTDLSSCVGTLISTFPHLETFDSGIGDWSQDSVDDGDWTLNANGTPNNGTGPSDDITGGGNYFYTEASSNGLGSNATTILTSPCYDLSSLIEGTFAFYYHMYGTNVGDLDLEISSDNGANWTNIFSASGNIGDIWNLINIDLSSYLGETVKFRFIGLTGNGWSSDIAIDNISVGDPIVPEYCDSQSTNANLYLGIASVQLNSIDNTSSSQLYTDYTGISTTLAINSTYSLTITPEYNVSTSNAVGYSVWIDYNFDGDFIDSGEQIFSQSPITGGGSVSGNFTIPSNIDTGNVRMRVSLKFNDIPDSCEVFTYGEVEDYNIYLYDGLVYNNSIWSPNAPSTLTSLESVLVEDGTYNVNSDISIDNIEINPGATVNLSKANSITINNGIINNGEFVLNSDSNEYSSLVVDGSITGDIKYNRHVNSNANGNDLISPPVSGQSFTDFITNNSNILSNTGQTLYLFGPFEKPANDYQLFTNVESSSLIAGTGYRAASTDNQGFMFSGAVTNTELVVPIVKVGSSNEEWNLIGNPYTSYIKLADFLAANLSELDPQSAAVYGYDADDTNGSNWAIWNLAYSDANPNTLIAPGQGFFVSSKDGGANISFTPSMRSLGSSDDFIAGRTGTNSINHSVIEISSATQMYSTELYLTNNATLGLDLGYDAEHFGGAPSQFAIYSELTQDNQGLDMAIQSIGFDDIDNNTVIPLGVNVAQGEQVTISLTESNFEYSLYLEDTFTNTFTLLNTSGYTFNADTNLSGTGRFYLRLSQSVLSVSDSNLDKIQIYTDSDLEKIIVKGELDEATEFILYDIQGREVMKRTLDSKDNIHSINTSQYITGVYLVKLTNNLNSITQRLIIR
ncbi:M14 family zinc carboxypeptidase [Winogradskyella sp. PG-2]|uniref:M14 family zinc carboxypeptidase n=1 Tax=Winogradskyella sp. PG-2 TaxID=754409 RepID=UPI0009FC84D1|nr:M14 family zinc carboxypeptidase [Winogradskyella sp. PG-2]